jgi:hypothetical protein
MQDKTEGNRGTVLLSPFSWGVGQTLTRLKFKAIKYERKAGENSLPFEVLAIIP